MRKRNLQRISKPSEVARFLVKSSGEVEAIKKDPLAGYSVKARRAFFRAQSQASLPPALPRDLRVRIAKVTGKIQEFLTRPREVVLDQAALLGLIPTEWKLEYSHLETLVRIRIANDLDPQNRNSEAYRDAQRERYAVVVTQAA